MSLEPRTLDLETDVIALEELVPGIADGLPMLMSIDQRFLICVRDPYVHTPFSIPDEPTVPTLACHPDNERGELTTIEKYMEGFCRHGLIDGPSGEAWGIYSGQRKGGYPIHLLTFGQRATAFLL